MMVRLQFPDNLVTRVTLLLVLYILLSLFVGCQSSSYKVGGSQPGGDAVVIEKVIERAITPNIRFNGTLYSNSSNPEVTFKAEDSALLFRCAVDADPLVACVSPVKLENLSQGPHVFNLVVQDPMTSESMNDKISFVVDSEPPFGSFLFSDGANPIYYTSSTGLQIRVTATDAYAGVSEVQLCNVDGGNEIDCEWRKFETDQAWNLLAGEAGDRTVRIRLKDAIGNIVTLGNQTILYDANAPVGSMTIVDSDFDGYTNSQTVDLDVRVTQSVSGVSHYKVCNGGTALPLDSECGDWLLFDNNGSHPPLYHMIYGAWALSAGDGLKQVWVKVRSQSGAVASFTDTITLDKTPPDTPSIAVTDPNSPTVDYSNQITVNLNIGSRDPEQQKWLVTKVSTNASPGSSPFSGWFLHNAVPATIDLPNTNATYYVHLWAKDSAGNVSVTPKSDSIVLDTVPPIAPTISVSDPDSPDPAYTNQLTLNLSVGNRDPIEQKWVALQATMSESPPSAPSIGWYLHNAVPTTFTLPDNGDGTYYVHFWAKDAAGNTSSAIHTQIILNRTAPVAPAFTMWLPSSPDSAYTNSLNVLLKVNTCNAGVVAFKKTMSGVPPDSSGLVWEPCSNYLLPGGRAFSLADLGDGRQYVYLWTRNQAGNISPLPTAYSLIIDRQTPAAPAFRLIDSDSGSEEYVQTRSIGFFVDNFNAIEQKWILLIDQTGVGSLPGNPTGTWNSTANCTAAAPCSFTLSAQPDGPHGIYAWVKDSAGNVSVSGVQTTSDSIILDTANPECSPSGTVSKTILSGETLVDSTFSCTDANSISAVIKTSEADLHGTASVSLTGSTPNVKTVNFDYGNNGDSATPISVAIEVTDASGRKAILNYELEIKVPVAQPEMLMASTLVESSIAVADKLDNQIYVYDFASAPIPILSETHEPAGIAFHYSSGNLIFSVPSEGKLYRMDSAYVLSKTPTNAIALSPSYNQCGNKSIITPMGLAVHPDPAEGSLYVADLGNQRVIRLGRTSFDCKQIVVDKIKLGVQEFRPVAIAFASNGDMWVSDSANSKIWILTYHSGPNPTFTMKGTAETMATEILSIFPTGLSESFLIRDTIQNVYRESSDGLSWISREDLAVSGFPRQTVFARPYVEVSDVVVFDHSGADGALAVKTIPSQRP